MLYFPACTCCAFFLVRIYPSALFSVCASFRVRFFPMRLYIFYFLYFQLQGKLFTSNHSFIILTIVQWTNKYNSAFISSHRMPLLPFPALNQDRKASQAILYLFLQWSFHKGINRFKFIIFDNSKFPSSFYNP